MPQQQTALRQPLARPPRTLGRARRLPPPAPVLARAAAGGIPALVAASLGCWQLTARSFSQDEAATLAAARRPAGALLGLLMHIDGVHGVYYYLIHVVILLGGASPAAVRLPSVIATAAAAGATAVLGARLAGPRAGFAAGLLYAVSPPATAWAQAARPFALATALTVICCCRLVALAETGRRRDAAAYAAAVALAGWVNVLTLLVLLAHAATLLVARGWRRRLRRFLAALAGAGIALLPVIMIGLSQVSQVRWENPPGTAALLTLAGVLALAAALCWLAARGSGGQDGPRALAAVAAPWLMLPPVILAVVSGFTPIWQPRYVLFCLPALALLIAAGVMAMPARAGAAAVAAAVAAALAAQPLVRPAVAADDLRAVSVMLSRQARPGDAVVFTDLGRRLIKSAYPAGFAHLRDVGLDTSAAYRDTLYGHDVSRAVLSHRLSAVRRLWVISYRTAYPAARYGTPRVFCAEHVWQFPGSTAVLYQRCPARPAG